MHDFKATLLGLTEELFQANIYYGVSKALRGRMDSPEFSRARNLFMSSYYGCLREALLSLCKLLITDTDSASIPSALNYSEQNAAEFSCATVIEVREAVTACRGDLKSLEPTIPKLKRLRDQDLAHLDKRRISDPKSLIPTPIEFAEIESCLMESLEILRKIMAMYDDTKINFQEIGDVVNKELDIVLSALGGTDPR